MTDPSINISAICNDSAFNNFERTKAYATEIKKFLAYFLPLVAEHAGLSAGYELKVSNDPSRNEVLIRIDDKKQSYKLFDITVSVDEQDMIHVNARHYFIGKYEKYVISNVLPPNNRNFETLQSAMQALTGALMNPHEYRVSHWWHGQSNPTTTGFLNKNAVFGALKDMGAFAKQIAEVNHNPPDKVDVPGTFRDFRDLN